MDAADFPGTAPDDAVLVAAKRASSRTGARRRTIAMVSAGVIQLAWAAFLGGTCISLIIPVFAHPSGGNGGGLVGVLLVCIVGCLIALLHLIIGVHLLRMRRWAIIAHLVTSLLYGAYSVVAIQKAIHAIAAGGSDIYYSTAGDLRVLVIAATVFCILILSNILTLSSRHLAR